MKKRTLALWIAAAMLSVLLCGMLTACGGGKPEGDSGAPGFGESMHEPETPSQMEYSWEREWNERRDDIPAWYYDKKAVLADMTAEEACAYLDPFFLSGGIEFTDANTLDPEKLIHLVLYENRLAWALEPEYYENGGKRMTYDEVVEELQHYLDFDPEKVDLKSTDEYDPKTDTFLFVEPAEVNVYPFYPQEDRWEGSRRIITIWYSPTYSENPDEPPRVFRSKLVFTLEQNGDYIRYVSFERVPNEKWTEPEKKTVLADMTSEEACNYTVAFFLSGGRYFTDANTLDPFMMTILLQYMNSDAWHLQPEIWEPGGVRMTYDEVVEELQHYLDFDPDKVGLKNLSYGVPYDPETDTYLFSCDLGGTCPIVPLEDKWEGNRRLITIGYDPKYYPESDVSLESYQYQNVFTLEQNGEYIRYVSYERVPNKKWKGN